MHDMIDGVNKRVSRAVAARNHIRIDMRGKCTITAMSHRGIYCYLTAPIDARQCATNDIIEGCGKPFSDSVQGVKPDLCDCE